MWKPKLTISGAELIVPRPELIICEAKLTVSKAKAIISEPHLIICVTHIIISDTGSVRLGATAPPVKFLKASLPRTNPHFGECGRRAGHFDRVPARFFASARQRGRGPQDGTAQFGIAAFSGASKQQERRKNKTGVSERRSF